MVTERDRYSTGRLTARPVNTSGKAEFTTGVQRLGLDSKKDGLFYVPKRYSNSQPAALAVMLHGAGAPAEQGLSLLQRYADEKNIILIAPASRSYSWDIIASDAFGPDVIFIDQALEFVFGNFAIDPAHVAIGGFSDGASYGLCLGLTNGDLFTHIMAFSPGFVYTLEKNGKPNVYISHGVHDTVLPIDPCARRVVPQLQRQGLEVNYTEFEGGHEIPSNIAESAAEWFIGSDTVSQQAKP
ncbi:phospholipase [Pontibacter diazotrophicus]|uniref:Phospholipase n=1 Tax=Pontibacter diazotrophicus TaxID=1400979 RepID=A0A3D8LAW0_9BACT|nr:alpha/beta hydrolase-fold protein [Pontibacter diazotrophicus]RDV14493.1 phospholipase [Pontibacter diazotrophicus]